jgi:hypothetical protein
MPGEINDVITEGMLSSEMHILRLVRTQSRPEFLLSKGQIATQFSGSTLHFRSGLSGWHRHSLNLPPPGLPRMMPKPHHSVEEKLLEGFKQLFSKAQVILLPPNPVLIWGKAGKGAKTTA